MLTFIGDTIGRLFAAIWFGISRFVGAIWARITDEPVLTLALIQAGLAMWVGFGLRWSGDQVALVNAFAAAVLGFIARRQVTPVH